MGETTDSDVPITQMECAGVANRMTRTWVPSEAACAEEFTPHAPRAPTAATTTPIAAATRRRDRVLIIGHSSSLRPARRRDRRPGRAVSMLRRFGAAVQAPVAVRDAPRPR